MRFVIVTYYVQIVFIMLIFYNILQLYLLQK